MEPLSDAVCQAAKWLKSNRKGYSPKFNFVVAAF